MGWNSCHWIIERHFQIRVNKVQKNRNWLKEDFLNWQTKQIHIRCQAYDLDATVGLKVLIGKADLSQLRWKLSEIAQFDDKRGILKAYPIIWEELFYEEWILLWKHH